MATLPPSTHRIKVVALLTHERERVLIDEPLTLDTLSLTHQFSPLSRAFLDGAGMRYRPVGIAVYVDGKRVWSEDCPLHGRTDAYPSTRPMGATIDAIPFCKAFGNDWHEYQDERIADHRAAWEHLRNNHEDVAEEIAADLLEAAGSLRPKLRPSKPTPEPAVAHAPCPASRFGDCTSPLGLPYRMVRQCRRTP